MVIKAPVGGGVIAREEITSMRRWDPPAMAPGSESKSSAGQETERAGADLSTAAVQLPTADDLEVMYARAEAEGRQQGYQSGYDAGLSAGREAGMAAARQDSEMLKAIILGFGRPLRDLDAAVEEATLALALEVARQVIRAELRMRPESLLPLLREALEALPLRSANPSIRLHPEDLALVGRLAPELVEEGVLLEADEELERGGPVLAAQISGGGARPDRRWHRRGVGDEASVLDLRLETRWRQALEQLFGAAFP